ncbi:MAG TPA: NAD+ synthase [Nitrososphaera sp.]|nr:NAD+ synthase [Nitrososphaera sp.]
MKNAPAPARLTHTSKKIERFISDYVSKSSAKGLVIGLSGGLDSAVVLKLAVNALGPERVLGLVMPSDATPAQDTRDAVDHANSLGVRYLIIDIGPLLRKYAEILPWYDKKTNGNLMARIRMNILYHHAGLNGYLVVGTSDKSELYLGYFTKFGDGAADLLPIAGLYKTEVRALARHLGIPEAIAEKKSSPRLWADHLAEKELGMDYETIDPVLRLLVDKRMMKKKPRTVAKMLGIQEESVLRVKEMMDKSEHKRSLPARIDKWHT